jgi:hypothetical protein
MRRATRYIRSRHDQKSSLLASRRSARPAKARWKAWLCAFDQAGQERAVEHASRRRRRGDAGVTSLQRPSSPARSTTCSRQPSGVQARGAQSRRPQASGLPVERGLQQRAQHRLQARARAGSIDVGRLFLHVARPAHLELDRVHALPAGRSGG